MSGADQQRRDAGGRRGWWLVGLLAVSGAVVGAFAGYRLDPDVSGLVPSLAVAGFGLGGLIGLLLLAPVGLWRAWRRRARRRSAPSDERADLPEGTGLWHTAEHRGEVAPAAAAELPGAVEARPSEKGEPERPEESASTSGAEQAKALTPQEHAESEHEEPTEPAGNKPGLEPQGPPPPAGEEPGWYPDPARDGMRRYWDGHAWTGHVWRGRKGERTRKSRNRR